MTKKQKLKRVDQKKTPKVIQKTQIIVYVVATGRSLSKK